MKISLTGIDKNTLGNLMILEYSINRKIKNKSIQEKLPEYQKSKFEVVKWEAENMDKNYTSRQKEKIDMVVDYVLECQVDKIQNP